jgi:hypothetical protein
MRVGRSSLVELLLLAKRTASSRQRQEGPFEVSSPIEEQVSNDPVADERVFQSAAYAVPADLVIECADELVGSLPFV